MNHPSSSWWNKSYGARQQNYRRVHLGPGAENYGCLTALHSKLHTFRKEGRYWDITVTVEKKSFKCHRLVLASVFRTFDENIFCGRATGADTIREIDLDQNEPPIHADELEVMLDFAYTGKLPKLTGWNVGRYLRIGERLQSPEVEALCTDFIRREIHTFASECILEILEYAHARNKSLMKDLCECIVRIIPDFDVRIRDGSLREAISRMPFELLSVLMTAYRASLLPDDGFLSQFHDEKIMQVMLRWAASRGEIDRYWERICKMFDCGKVSQQFLNWSSRMYGIDRTNNESDNESLCSWSPDSNNNGPGSPTVPFRTPRMYAFVKHDERMLGSACNMNVFEFEKYRLDWLNVLDGIASPWSVFRTLYLAEPEDSRDFFMYIYGLGKDRRDFYRHFSILEWDEEKEVSRLSLPPCESPHFVMCGLDQRVRSCQIFWYNCDAHQYSHYEGVNSIVRKKFGNDEVAIRRGIYGYHCPTDTWYSMPEPKIKVAGASITADDELIYLIGGETQDNVIPNGLLQAYDQRCSMWLQLPESKNSYCGAICSCSLDGMIYVSDGKLIERYNNTAGKWEEIKIACDIDSKDNHFLKKRKMNWPYPKLKMVPYRKGLWIYNLDIIQSDIGVQHTIIDPYNLTVDKESISILMNKAVVNWLHEVEEILVDKFRVSDWEIQKGYQIMDVVAHL